MTARTTKRSVSPFGTAPALDNDPLAAVTAAIAQAFGPAEGKRPKNLSSVADAPFISAFLRRTWDAPANDAPWLPDFCGYLVKSKSMLEGKGVADAVYAAMEAIFDRKTELFLVDHHVVTEEEYQQLLEQKGQEAVAKITAGEARDHVLFARERDTLAGGFFAPWTEREPGTFSAFVQRWAESDNPDRVLHFLDFCAGSRNPTFEYYLLFTHPALARWSSSKSQLRALFERVGPVLLKLKSPTWEPSVKKSLGL